MRLLLRKLSLMPFYMLVLITDLAGMIASAFVRRTRTGLETFRWKPGISLIIPERRNQPMLRRCLSSLQAACEALAEPVEIIVVVSDSDADAYADLQKEFPAIWLFDEKPLWFIEAIRRGISASKHHWIYLLNSDMVLHPDALCEVAKWRSSSVFAIASQIQFIDPVRRREETGWTAMRSASGLIEIYDATPEDQDGIRGHAYAGGGSSLFRRDLLERFSAGTEAYTPFYWEDVEWGLAAWRAGYRSLFCPRSQVWHEHRSTNLQFFTAEEIQRIFRLNALRFQLRNALIPASMRTVFSSIARLEPRSFREMQSAGSIIKTLQSRFRCRLSPLYQHGAVPAFDMYFNRLRNPARPLILIVSPYTVYPPSHGGARRIHRLIDSLEEDFDIILLSDEINDYSASSLKYFRKCHAVCLVGGRPEHPGTAGRRERILNHSHRALAAHLQALILIHDPDIVQIEYIELAKLVEKKDARPWVLTLHDVLLNPSDARSCRDDRFELQYIRCFDAVVTCSPEDRALIEVKNIHIVPNGANIPVNYLPSKADGPILFLGPFRYAPNFAGIMKFLKEHYPAVRARVANTRIWILGGSDARNISRKHDCFAQAGVRVFDYIENVTPFLESCSVTINPNRGVRGSAIKVIESIAAGRVCLSTEDGARGFREAEFASLVISDDEKLVNELVRLLTDVEYRHRIEVPAHSIQHYSWKRSAEEQARIYNTLLRDGSSVRMPAFAQVDTKAG